VTASRAGACLVAALLPVGGSADAEPTASEPVLSAIVASAPGATVGVLPAGGWQVELAPLVAGDVDHAVSPDGRRIAFASERDGNFEIFVADPEARALRRLTRSGRAAEPQAGLVAGREADRLGEHRAGRGGPLRDAGRRVRQAATRRGSR
jgi:hypothetical protein